MADQRVRLCLVGAALDTGNLGVSALGTSVLSGVLERAPEASIIAFDNGRGRGPLELEMPGRWTGARRQGAWFSKRIHRPESLIGGAVQASLGLRGNANIRAMTEATAVLDISGGDSFSDIYGLKRFSSIALPKLLALHLETPLMLLPQTYGPFRSTQTRRIAQDIVRRTDRAWARDPESFQKLRELAGADFDPLRHRESVDVAFALPARRPASWPQDQPSCSAQGPLVGINVSGLLCNNVDAATTQFGLRANVLEVTIALVERLLQEGARILLVPHVRGSSAESDDLACEQVMARTDPEGARVKVLPPGFDASETKWCIAQTDWMVGGRMHATIAALSSHVPVAGLAYSDKFAGVFDRCGVGDQALDIRALTTVDLLDALWVSWERRQQTAERLGRNAPAVTAQAAQGFDELVERIRELV